MAILKEDLIQTEPCRYGVMSFFRNDNTVSRSLREYGEWAQAEIDLLACLIDPGDTVLDIGAFVGTHTLAFARKVGNPGTVYAFEPQPVFFEVLKKNISQNGLTNVRLYDVAVSEKRGLMELVAKDASEPGNFGGTGILEIDPTGGDTSALKSTELLPIDQLGIKSCALIKVDTHNMEIDVLKGALQTLRTTRPVVYAECNSLEYGWPIVEVAGEEAYRAYLFNGQAYNPENFRQNRDNFLGKGREAGLVLIPADRLDVLLGRLVAPGIAAQLVPISRLDDLALALLKKPQYKYEVLAKTKAASALGVNFWANEVEVGQFHNKIADLDAERSRLSAEVVETQRSQVETAKALARTAELLESVIADREIVIRHKRSLLKKYSKTLSALASVREQHAETVSTLGTLSLERDRVAGELSALREQHAETISVLGAVQAEYEQTAQELEEKSSLLSQIQGSHGWKGLSLYYRLRQKLFPERMRGRIREGVALLRDARLVSASGLFDKDWYLRRNPDVARAGVSPLRHYLRRGALEGRDPSMLFDSDWYLTQNPDVAKAGMNPLVHYLRHGANEGRDPSPHFDTASYLKQYPDVAKAGLNPLRHFLLRRGVEQREPSPLLNTRKYLQMHPEVALAKMNPLAHFFRSGKSHLPVSTDDSKRPPAGDPKLMGIEPSGSLWAALNSSEPPPEQEDRSYDSMAALLHSSYRSRLETLVLPRPEAFSVGEHQYSQCAAALEFSHAAVPLVSIVIPVCNQLRYTLECLTSISRHSDGIDYEVVVIDDGSSDATPGILSSIANLVYVRNDRNLGFIRSCNRGAERSRGKYIVFFNNDAQATRGWLRPLIETFNRHTNVGAVGPKILYPNGRLQEAGALVNHDGTSTLVGLFDDPSLPQYNRLREVPYCSGVCLTLERKIFLDIGGFDEELAPAYCEDCDLGFRLRRLGLRVFYNPEAVVLHHLSVTSDALIKGTAVVHNQQKLAERWQREIDTLNEVKLIALYLPQFHPIPENDRWWGKGFTEWTNVAKARPNYFGHYQPHIPIDLGFYDLRLDAVREQQGLLARRYGIYGFCYYYYWFAGKRLLEEPLERMLETNKPDLPFCLMWANENWTRRWDGQEKHVLIAQQHSDEDDIAVMQDLIRYLKHRNYIRVNGKPLLLVYRVNLFPSILRTTEIWRKLCHKEGIGEIYLAMAESFEYVQSSADPASLGFDASIEFPPHGMSAPIRPPGAVINPKFNGVIHDYRQIVADYLQLPMPAHVRFRCVMPGWDNTARRQDDPVMFEHTSPGAYQAWLEAIMETTRQYNFGDERLVFINAWNEWAEGNHLEPDKRNGHAFLEATLKAKQAWLRRSATQW